MTKPIAPIVATALAISATSLALAFPRAGDVRPNAPLRDAWDRTSEVAQFGAKPTLVVYEDKDSATMNKAFKAELAELAKGDRYKDRILLLAVADVGGYDYWPVRGFVKDAIQDESRKQNTVIYCDWDGSFRKAFGLVRGTSNIVFYGRDGRLRFAHAGALSANQRKSLIAHLRTEAEEPAK